MNKKGIMQSALVIIILSAISMIVVTLLFVKSAAVGASIAKSGTCTAEAIQKDFFDTLSDKFAGMFRNTNIYLQNCDIDVIHVSKDEYKNEAEVDELFAQESVQCYNQFKDLDIFPSGDKIPSSREDEVLPTWKKAYKWFKSMFAGTVIVDAQGETRTAPYYAPPVYCAVCSKITFDQANNPIENGDRDNLPMFGDTLKNSNEDLISTFDSNYDFIDQGRNKDRTQLDTLERYSYDPTKTNVIVYYRRYAYDYTWKSFQEDAPNFLSRVASQASDLIYYPLRLLSGNGGVMNADDIKEKVVEEVSRNEKKKAITSIGKIYEEPGFFDQIGFLVLTSVQNDIGLYKWFTSFEYEMQDEYGVASVPYEYVAHQCDFVANGYGEIKG